MSASECGAKRTLHEDQRHKMKKLDEVKLVLRELASRGDGQCPERSEKRRLFYSSFFIENNAKIARLEDNGETESQVAQDHEPQPQLLNCSSDIEPAPVPKKGGTCSSELVQALECNQITESIIAELVSLEDTCEHSDLTMKGIENLCAFMLGSENVTESSNSLLSNVAGPFIVRTSDVMSRQLIASILELLNRIPDAVVDGVLVPALGSSDDVLSRHAFFARSAVSALVSQQLSTEGVKCCGRVLRAFLGGRQVLKEDGLVVLETILQEATEETIRSVLSDNDLLLLLSSSLSNSSFLSPKSARFGKLLANLCRKLPPSLPADCAEAIRRAIAANTTFVAKAATAEINKRLTF